MIGFWLYGKDVVMFKGLVLVMGVGFGMGWVMVYEFLVVGWCVFLCDINCDVFFWIVGELDVVLVVGMIVVDFVMFDGVCVIDVVLVIGWFGVLVYCVGLFLIMVDVECIFDVNFGVILRFVEVVCFWMV